MPNSPRTATPTPASSDSPDGPTQMAALVAQLEKFTVPKYADTTARTAGIASPSEGDFAYMLDTHKLVRYGPGGVYVSMVTPVFSSSVARDATMTAPAEGDEVYRSDIKSFQVYTGSTWSTVGPVMGTLTAFTPTLTQSATPTKTVTMTGYSRVGRWVHGNVRLDVTGAGTAANAVVVGLPVAGSGVSHVIGQGFIFDTSAATFYTGTLYMQTSTTAVFVSPSTGGFLGGTTFTAALANTDAISYTFAYEAAADA